MASKSISRLLIRATLWERHHQTDASERAIREIITDLETIGLVKTWIQSKGTEGRVKQIETAFEPERVEEAKETYVKQSPNLEQSSS